MAVKVCADHCQGAQRNAFQVVRDQIPELRVRAYLSGNHARLGVHARGKGRGHVAELLISDQAGDEHAPGVLWGEVVQLVIAWVVFSSLGLL